MNKQRFLLGAVTAGLAFGTATYAQQNNSDWNNESTGTSGHYRYQSQDSSDRGQYQYRGNQSGNNQTSQIRETLRQAGLTSDQIRRLEQNNFSQQDVQQTVRRTLENSGWNSNQASQQAQRIAQQVQQYTQNQYRGSDNYTVQGRQYWRGDQDRFSGSYRGEREQGYQDDRYEQRNSYLDVNESEYQSEEDRQSRRMLKRFGLMENRIHQLAQRDFPEDEVAQAVTQAMQREGLNRSLAQEHGRWVAGQVQRLQAGEGRSDTAYESERSQNREQTYGSYNDRYNQGSRNQSSGYRYTGDNRETEWSYRTPSRYQTSTPANEDIARLLRQNGVADSEIQDLQEDNFPREQVQQRLQSALKERGWAGEDVAQRTQQIVRQVQQLKQGQGTSGQIYEQQSGRYESRPKEGTSESEGR